MTTTATAEAQRNQAAAGRQTRFPITRTGAWTRPFNNQAVAMAAAAALAPPAPTCQQLTVVVDPTDSAAFARQAAALACRAAGRIVVHTSPGPQPAWRLGTELLCALGKHWDRSGQRCDIAVEVLCRVWLRAEQVTELVVLRAHQITSKAMAWLFTLLAGEQVRLWLCTPTPLVDLDPAADAAVTPLSPAQGGAAPAPSRLRVADLELDDDSHQVWRGGSPVQLSPTEFKLLRYLMSNVGRVLSKGQLLDHVWNYDFGGEGGIVESYVSYLRRKVDTAEPRLIHTIRGVGYVMRLPDRRRR